MESKTETTAENTSSKEALENTPPVQAGLGDSLPISEEATGIVGADDAKELPEGSSEAPKSEAEAASPMEGLRDTSVSPSEESAPALENSQSESEDADLPAPSADDAFGKTEEELPSLPASDVSTDEPKEEAEPVKLDEAAALPGLDESDAEVASPLEASTEPSEEVPSSDPGATDHLAEEAPAASVDTVAGPDTEAPAVPAQEAAKAPEELTEMHDEAAPIAEAVPSEVTGALKDAGNTLAPALCQLGGFQEEIAKLEGEAAARFQFLRQKATEFVAALEAVFKRG